MKMKKIAYLIVLLLGVTVFTACNDSSDIKKLDPIPDEVNRTVLVYLGCDNNFYGEVEEKIEMLRSNWNRNYAGRLLVYGDSNGEGAKLVHIYNNDEGVNVAETVAEYGSENSADPAVLTRLLNDVKAQWPSDNDNYGLVILSHGTGWIPAGVEVNRPRSTSSSSEASISPLWVISDVTAGEQMDIPDMADAIPFKLEFVVFDACNMASAEVVYELKDKVDYIVASTAEVLVPGFVYTNMPKRMMSEVADLEGVARDFYEYYANLNSYATVSLIDTSKIDGVADICEEVLSAGVDGQSLLSGVQSFGYGSYKLFIDLEDYVTTVDSSNDIAARLAAAIDDCVIYKANTDYYYSVYARPVNTHSGLTIYVPQSSYTVMNAYYKTLKWYDKVTPYVP